MKSFLITYLFYNEEGIPIQSSLPVMIVNVDELALLSAIEFSQLGD